ncbi:hypothetical protein EV645_3996 [Kribbella rubisoli]|uniref:Uncharacterized protein n=1 Tax=Kribbella rubisoli TaxID=3075929 RepID=A0A4Q7X0V3_9ACTN|nr:hypothetical protein [Kribbella rubisoli]RZU16431.1 hypothetical protein EV645_3996 [Kribbella rubisoli]
MSRSNPLSSRCTATSKATKLQCTQWVVGGGVCFHHGGAAPQVAASREARVAVWEAANRGDPIEVRDPGEALLAAATTADGLVQRLQHELAEAERLAPATLMALGEWLDRVGRLSKTVLDARIDERRTRVSEAQGQRIFTVLRDVLVELGHDVTPGSPTAQVVVRHLRAMAEPPAVTS